MTIEMRENVVRLMTSILSDARRYDAVKLLYGMRDRALKFQDASKPFENWLETGRELSLRISCAPFGDYKESLFFSQTVDELQAAIVQALELKDVEVAQKPEEDQLTMPF